MENKGKNGYSAISIKAQVATNFRSYSKQFSRSNSELLESMVFFFQRNEMDPFETNVPKLVSELKKNGKRIEYLISIIKESEKRYIGPIFEMIKILFEPFGKERREEEKEKKEKIRREKRYRDTFQNPNVVPVRRHELLQEEFERYKKKCHRLLDRVELVEPTFGKPYYRFNIPNAELFREKIWLENN